MEQSAKIASLLNDLMPKNVLVPESLHAELSRLPKVWVWNFLPAVWQPGIRT